MPGRRRYLSRRCGPAAHLLPSPARHARHKYGRTALQTKQACDAATGRGRGCERCCAQAGAMGADIGAMAYWAVARLEPHRERLALHCLGLAGFETYFPRLREKRMSHGRRIEVRWHAARWSVGILGLIMDGIRPAKVADSVIEEIRSRERGGLVELPRRDGLKAGDQVRILAGPFEGHLGLYAGMRPHERVLVLLALLGGQQRVELPKDSIEAVRP